MKILKWLKVSPDHRGDRRPAAGGRALILTSRYFGRALLGALAVGGVVYLFAYGRALARRWEASESSFDVRWLNEISVWFYRERDAAGRPAGPYKLSRSLSEIDPADGFNWEVRIPGWIPAVGALSVLATAGILLSGKRERERD